MKSSKLKMQNYNSKFKILNCNSRLYALDFKLQKGFTLVEVMVAMVVVGLVFGVIITSSTALSRRSRDQQRITDLQSLRAALAQYYADQHFYPDSTLNIATATQIDDQVGNPQNPIPRRVYLTPVPINPSGTNPYSYTPFITLGGSSCSNVLGSSTTCQYYRLCAQLENPPPSSTNCVAGYNFEVNPYNSTTP